MMGESFVGGAFSQCAAGTIFFWIYVSFNDALTFPQSNFDCQWRPLQPPPSAAPAPELPTPKTNRS